MSVVGFDNYVEDDLLSVFLRYGLFIGAIFQLVCIVSSIVLPAASDLVNGDGESVEDIKHNNDVNALNNVRRLHKFRKQEKKKRR